MRHVLLSLMVLVGCTKAGSETPPGEPTPMTPVVKETGVAPMPPPTPQPPKTVAATRVELTAVTLADDCGGTPPWTAPPAAKPAAKAAPTSTQPEGPRSRERADQARMRCEQTSMQLAIIATGAATIQIKSVELLDESGASIGMLTATKPTMWSAANSAYEPWDEKVTTGTVNVSYVLGQPAWGNVKDRWNKTFTLKTVVSVGGVDQTATKDVTLSAPTSLPPNVRT
jgi:hypothetical protein